jgi:glycosyltransferase involved in cell wall biosynthesis
VKTSALIILPTTKGTIHTWGGHGIYHNEIRNQLLTKFSKTWGNKILIGDQIAEYYHTFKKINKIQKFINPNFKILIHITNNFTPIPTWVQNIRKDFDTKIIYTIVDYQHYSFPKFFTKDEIDIRKKSEKDIRSSNAGIFISHFTFKEFKRFSKDIAPDFIKKISYQGVNLKKINSTNLFPNNQFFKSNYGEVTNYLIYPAKGWLHKNHSAFIKSIKHFKMEYQKKDIKFLFTNLHSDEILNLRNTAVKSGVGELVQFYEYISNEDLSFLYLNSLGIVFPSLYEGFGYPIVESQNFGKSFFGFQLDVFKEVQSKYSSHNINLFKVNDFMNLHRSILKNQEIKKFKKVNLGFNKQLFEWSTHVKDVVRIYESL